MFVDHLVYHGAIPRADFATPRYAGHGMDGSTCIGIILPSAEQILVLGRHLHDALTQGGAGELIDLFLIHRRLDTASYGLVLHFPPISVAPR